ncbi:hypothetical protein KGF54_002759 [Candida jiufengensis]|uniref:uncharacterized protein n=1 Tax=Candida jiufengensis TaxID=497108 RepID=UPI002225012E|nr:uncharacterized protein KGF54_002759 [Candida jiufengensis]KAI5953387.1 hypothetical protein KGF54_002759 [Candida jiufengensis]
MQYLNLFNQIVLISINLPNHPDSNDRQEATDTLNTNEPHPIPDEEFNDGVTPDADTTNTNKSWFKKLQLWFKKKTSREKLTFLLSNEKYKNNEQIRDIEMQFSEHSKLYRKLQIGRIIALIIITIGILLDAISGYYFYLGICSK